MPQNSTAGGPRFCLRLLGRWQLVADGEDVELGHREERLTALLGLTGRSSRPHVAGILWPESTDARALASLRRAVLQTQNRIPGLLQADRLTIGLSDDVVVDVEEVRRAAAATEGTLIDDGAEGLPARLAGEELLPGWYDDWVIQEREGLEQLRVKALERVARHALDTGDLALTIDAAHASSDIDPLLESASELAIRAHLDRGDLGSARREFDRYRDAVRSELDTPPSRTILDLVEPILAAVSAGPPEPPTVDHQLPVRTRAAIPGPPHESARSTSARRAVVRLLGVAALILAAALVVAGVGHEGGVGDVSDSGGPTQSTMRVLPAEGAIRAGEMVVRPVGTAIGRAAFLVRATLRPALVHFEVRGRAGTGVVRNLLVRSARGRVLELDDLDPGVYRWLASSSVASTVSGRLRIPDPPDPPDPPVAVDADTALEPAGPASTATGSTAPASPTSSPSQSPVQQPSQQSGDSTPSDPAPEAKPTGRPNDPGTAPRDPVG